MKINNIIFCMALGFLPAHSYSDDRTSYGESEQPTRGNQLLGRDLHEELFPDDPEWVTVDKADIEADVGSSYFSSYLPKAAQILDDLCGRFWSQQDSSTQDEHGDEGFHEVNPTDLYTFSEDSNGRVTEDSLVDAKIMAHAAYRSTEKPHAYGYDLGAKGYTDWHTLQGVFGLNSLPEQAGIIGSRQVYGFLDIIVGLTGTDSLGKSVTDLMHASVHCATLNGGVHTGFESAYLSFKDDALQNIADRITNSGVDASNVRILVAGHSLGAALSNRLSADLMDRGHRNIVNIGFAHPGGMTEEACQELEKLAAATDSTIATIISAKDALATAPSAWTEFVCPGTTIITAGKGWNPLKAHGMKNYLWGSTLKQIVNMINAPKSQHAGSTRHVDRGSLRGLAYGAHATLSVGNVLNSTLMNFLRTTINYFS